MLIFQLDTRQSSSLQRVDFETEYLELSQLTNCFKLLQTLFYLHLSKINALPLYAAKGQFD
ncbi:hypothetical protein T09_3024 [Trichinella sp. T9]|nr:hypothetical protein T09_3024 [Trichinella sp. T9]